MQSKTALQHIIKIARVHFYKPIQIAEILHHDRTNNTLNLQDLESYRNASKRWRDQITQRLVGSISTSSQRYQDNLFDDNAMPPRLLAELADLNRRTNGAVEAYIYKSLQRRLSVVYEAEALIKQATPETFNLSGLLKYFAATPGLRRSIDKMYEITVYALFSTIVRALDVQVSMEIGNRSEEVLKDFESFIKTVLGVSLEHQRISQPAALYRVGVTNAADRGLDMLTNFGPVIQVKHLTLTPEKAQEITEGLAADGIIIVCVKAEEESIRAVLAQLGIDNRVQGIITLSDLENWYGLCFSGKYRETLGAALLSDLRREFDLEFPSGFEIVPFFKERGYEQTPIPEDWRVDDD